MSIFDQFKPVILTEIKKIINRKFDELNLNTSFFTNEPIKIIISILDEYIEGFRIDRNQEFYFVEYTEIDINRIMRKHLMHYIITANNSYNQIIGYLSANKAKEILDIQGLTSKTKLINKTTNNTSHNTEVIELTGREFYLIEEQLNRKGRVELLENFSLDLNAVSTWDLAISLWSNIGETDLSVCFNIIVSNGELTPIIDSLRVL
ncbi:MAG: hypothetical protein OHK0012_09800 [Synechococcales cyanobacterium]